MKKLVLLLILVISFNLTFSQKEVSMNLKGYYWVEINPNSNTSKTYDIIFEAKRSKLTLKFINDKVYYSHSFFEKNTFGTGTNFSFVKKTSKYLIGKKAGGYCFYDFQGENFYRLSYDPNSKSFYIKGIGKGYSEISLNITKLSSIIKKTSSIKKAIKYLVEEVENGF